MRIKCHSLYFIIILFYNDSNLTASLHKKKEGQFLVKKYKTIYFHLNCMSPIGSLPLCLVQLHFIICGYSRSVC